MRSLLLFSPSLLLLLSLLPEQSLSLRPGDCEVCISVVDRFRQTLQKDEEGDKTKIETKFKDFCKDLKLKENRFVSAKPV